MTSFFVAPRISTAPGALEQLSSLGTQRAAVVVDPVDCPVGEGAARRRGARAIDGDSRGPPVGRFRAVVGLGGETRRPTTSVRRGLDRGRGGRPNPRCGEGRLRVRYARPELDLASFTPLDELKLRSVAGFVAVPSTSGSGCDVSWNVMVRGGGGEPIELASRELVPDWSLLDPVLPATMPAQVTVDTGAELIAHAFEALVSEWANPFTDLFAREAISTAFSDLPKVARRPDDLELRMSIHHAATFAGLASSNAQLGADHALAVAIGPRPRYPTGGCSASSCRMSRSSTTRPPASDWSGRATCSVLPPGRIARRSRNASGVSSRRWGSRGRSRRRVSLRMS